MATHRADVAIIGGGPAGYAAALAAAGCGRTVILAEPERLGGMCVNWSCIPTNTMLAALNVSLEARELAFVGVVDAGDEVNMTRLSARREALVRLLGGGIARALRNAGVIVLPGRARLAAGGLSLTVDEGVVDVEAPEVVVAAGARWEVPELPGIGVEHVVTADVVQTFAEAPGSALVLGGGPAQTAFAIEYAFLLAALGTAVTFASPGPLMVPALDPELDGAVCDALATLGVEVLRDAAVIGGDVGKATVLHAGGESTVEADVVVVADRRVPAGDGVGLQESGVRVDRGAVAVDRSCRTNVSGVLAAGDVTGGWMTTAAALHTGDVAGRVASGEAAVTRLRTMPHVLHTFPGVGWAGLSEPAARAAGAPVATAVVDLANNGRSIAVGGRTGFLKLIADAATGELLGVHVVGPDTPELLAVASTAMQAELTVQDVAALVTWHPTLTESLVEAARQLA